MKIATQPVKSSNIGEIGYDAGSKTLAVKFLNGNVYHYSGVGQDEYDKMLKAKSVGGHLAKHIRPNFKGLQIKT